MHKVAENVAAIQASGSDTTILPYWRTQEDYDRRNGGTGHSKSRTRRNRDGNGLEERHVNVSFAYVDEK